MSRLVIYRDAERLAEHELARAVIGLGRHPENDIVLDDRTLSRFHAKIERRNQPDGVRWFVVDLGAQNGVHLNGERISSDVELHPGDRIELGRYTAVFEQPPPPKPNGKGGTAAKPSIKPAKVDEDLDIDLDLDDDDLGFRDDLGPDGRTVSGKEDNRTADLEDFDGASRVDYVPPKPTLVLLFNGMEVSRHPLTEGGLTIGRSKQCEIVISLLGLSRRHARVAQTDDGVIVEDLGSQNGTWVNNERIEGPRLLKHGDLLNFYDYGVLFLEDGDVEVGFPGAGFSPPSTEQRTRGQDALSAKETDQALAAPTAVPSKARQPTQRAPLVEAKAAADDDDDLGLGARASALPEETKFGRGRPPTTKKREGNSEPDGRFEFDMLGEGSFLGDEFEEGASKARDQSSVLDDGIAPAAKAMGTELIEGVDVSRGAADEDLEAEIAFQNAAGDDFDGIHTDGDIGSLGDRTTAGFDVASLGGGWPGDDDLDRALALANDSAAVTLDVTMRGKAWAQIPLSQPITRIGSDPRCECALPRSSQLRPWHATILQMGGAVLVVRGNRAAGLEISGREMDATTVRNGDVVKLGAVDIKFRFRR